MWKIQFYCNSREKTERKHVVYHIPQRALKRVSSIQLPRKTNFCLQVKNSGHLGTPYVLRLSLFTQCFPAASLTSTSCVWLCQLLSHVTNHIPIEVRLIKARLGRGIVLNLSSVCWSFGNKILHLRSGVQTDCRSRGVMNMYTALSSVIIHSLQRPQAGGQ